MAEDWGRGMPYHPVLFVDNPFLIDTTLGCFCGYLKAMQSSESFIGSTCLEPSRNRDLK